GMRDPQLLGHRHHRGADHEDLDPGQLVLTPFHQDGSWIGKHELSDDVENEDIEESRYVLEPATRVRMRQLHRRRSVRQRFIRASCSYPCHVRPLAYLGRGTSLPDTP